MMATTHVLAGLSVAGVVASVAPEYAPVAAAAAILGGAAPDFALYAGRPPLRDGRLGRRAGA